MKIESIGKTAFDAIYDANVNSVYYTVKCHIKNEHTVEEITQNVFLKFYKNMNHVDLNAAPKWLKVTAKNMALNHIRKDSREVLFAELYEENFVEFSRESSEDEIIKKLEKKEYSKFTDSILENLYKVNNRWYEAVTITYCLRKPQREVAEIMGIPIETLHSMLYRAKKWIRQNYEEGYECLNKA